MNFKNLMSIKIIRWVRNAVIVSLLLILFYSAWFVQTQQEPYRDIEYSFYDKYPRFDSEKSDTLEITSTSGKSVTFGPFVGITGPEHRVYKRSEEVTVIIRYSDSFVNCYFTPGAIALNGFVGTKVIKQIDNLTIELTISNIDTDDFTTPKTITVKGGTAIGADGSLSNMVTCNEFYIRQSGFQLFLINLHNSYIVILLPIVLGILVNIFTTKFHKHKAYK